MAKSKKAETAQVVEVVKPPVKDPKKEAKKKAKKEAKARVRAFMVANPKSEIFADLVTVVGTGGRGGGGGGGSQVKLLNVMRDLFKTNKTMSEDTIWKDFKLGRAEMRKISVNLIKRVEPANRIWVKFDAPTETYIVQGTGADTPKEWTGYTPVVIEDLEIT